MRVVQVFAGHKNPKTTERYRHSNLEALKLAVDKYHPLTDRSDGEGGSG